MKKGLLLALLLLLLLGQALPVFAESSHSVDSLIGTAKKLVGVKYKYGGTTTKGFDCSGFTSYVFEKLGIELPHSSKSQATMGTKVKKGEWKVGDLLFFKTNGKSISHVGIYVGNNKMINANTSLGVVVEDFVSARYWNNRYVSSVRIASFTTEKETTEALPVTPNTESADEKLDGTVDDLSDDNETTETDADQQEDVPVENDDTQTTDLD